MRRMSRRVVILVFAVLAPAGAAIGAAIGAALDDNPQRLVAMSEESLAATAPGSVTLGREATRVRLAPEAAAAPLSRRIAEHPGRRYLLVLGDLRATEQPGIVYEIYLGLPPGANPRENDPLFVGTLNFFGMAPPNTARNLSRSYDVTDVLRALQTQRRLDEPLAVTITPAAGPPASDTGQGVAQPSIGQPSIGQPSIGRIALTAQ